MPEQGQSLSIKSFLLTILKPFYFHLFLWAIVIVAWGFDISLKSFILKIILDQVQTGQLSSSLLYAVLLYGVTALIMLSVGRLHSWVYLKITPKLKKNITEFMMNNILNHNYETFYTQLSGSLANKINDVMVGVPGMICAFLDGFLYYFITFFVACLTLSSVDYRFSIAVLLWILLVVSVTLWAIGRSKDLADLSAESWSSVAGKIVDIFSNVTNVKIFSGKQQEYNNLNLVLEKAVKKEQDRSFFFLKLYIFQGAALLILQSYCIYILLIGVKNGTTTAGDFSLVLSINTSIADCLLGISQYFIQFTENAGKVQNGLKIVLSKETRLKIEQENPEFRVNQGLIIFENVNFGYKNSDKFFKEKSIEIPAGQKLGLVGDSGSGKSTFVNLILGMHPITTGRILIDKQDITNLSTDILSKDIALITQESQLFHRSLFENIAYGAPDVSLEDVIAAAKLACANDFIEKLPDGYNTLVGERGLRFSGGQRQRIALARAFLKKPSILILDEATSALDAITEASILANVKSMMKDKTLIIISHKLDSLTQMDRILVFNNGKIVEEGSHDDLLKQGEKYKQLWQAQHTTRLTPQIANPNIFEISSSSE